MWLWQVFATMMCVLLAWLLSPLGTFERREVNGESKRERGREPFNAIKAGFVEDPKGSGNLITAPAFQQR